MANAIDVRFSPEQFREPQIIANFGPVELRPLKQFAVQLANWFLLGVDPECGQAFDKLESSVQPNRIIHTTLNCS